MWSFANRCRHFIVNLNALLYYNLPESRAERLPVLKKLQKDWTFGYKVPLGLVLPLFPALRYR